jgi:hypothetical protein
MQFNHGQQQVSVAEEVTPAGLIHIPGDGPGIVYGTGLGVRELRGKGEYLRRAAVKNNVAFTFSNWQTPETGLMDQWVRHARRGLKHVSPQREPQVGVFFSAGCGVGARMAQTLEAEYGAETPLRGLILINPVFDATRIAAEMIGDAGRAHLAASGSNFIPFTVPVIPGVLPITQAHLENGQQHFLFGPGAQPPAAVRTHIFISDDDPMSPYPLKGAEKYAAAAKPGTVTIERLPKGGHELLTPGFLKRLWEKTMEMRGPSIRRAANENGGSPMAPQPR